MILDSTHGPDAKNNIPGEQRSFQQRLDEELGVTERVYVSIKEVWNS